MPLQLPATYAMLTPEHGGELETEFRAREGENGLSNPAMHVGAVAAPDELATGGGEGGKSSVLVHTSPSEALMVQFDAEHYAAEQLLKAEAADINLMGQLFVDRHLLGEQFIVERQITDENSGSDLDDLCVM